MSIRTPITAGLFYPLEEQSCRERMSSILQEPPSPETRSEPADTPAVLFPHAAWEFIAPLLAAGFRSLSPRRRDPGRIQHLLVAAPVHREPADAVYLPRDTAFGTPLGPLPVKLPGILTDSPPEPFRVDGIPHDEEHGIEVVLPFLRFLYPKAALIPLLIGRNTPRILSSAAGTLGPWYRRNRETALLVGTGNLSVFTAFPEGDPPEPPENGCFQPVKDFLEALLREGQPQEKHQKREFRVRRLDAYPSPEDPYQHKKIWYGTFLWEAAE